MDSPAETNAPPPLPDVLAAASAGFGLRFLARFVDLLFGFVLGLATGICGGIIFGIMHALGKMPEDWMEHIKVTPWHAYAFGILGAFLYYSFSEGICGATIGKLVCGLSVVQKDGRPCTTAGAFKRDLAYHWDALFFGLVAYTSMKDNLWQQRYGDRWADTVVVKKAGYTAHPPHPAWRFPVGIMVGSFFWMLCEVASLVLRIF